MTLDTVYSYIAQNPALVTWWVANGLAQFHPRLDRFPVLQVLAKQVALTPLLKQIAVDVAQAVVLSWGPRPEKAPVADSFIPGVGTPDISYVIHPDIPAAKVPTSPQPGA